MNVEAIVFSMIVVTTSWAPVHAFNAPGMNPQSPPTIAPARTEAVMAAGATAPSGAPAVAMNRRPNHDRGRAPSAGAGPPAAGAEAPGAADPAAGGVADGGGVEAGPESLIRPVPSSSSPPRAVRGRLL